MQVIAREFSLTLSRPTVPAGEVTIEFLNRGQDTHNLHYGLPSEGEPKTIGAFPETKSEHLGDLTFVMGKGSYTLFCSLEGHRTGGMQATLTVE